jgi:hypothetical protein
VIPNSGTQFAALDHASFAIADIAFKRRTGNRFPNSIAIRTGGDGFPTVYCSRIGAKS